MGLELDYIYGQTPLDDDEKEGLLIRTISTRNELDEFENLGVLRATEWILTSRINPDSILTEDFIKELHIRMFSEIWSWAGAFRRSNKNIGVDKFMIGIEIKKMLEDINFWQMSKTFSEEETAIRASHRLVSIHPFVNGNGRHSRLFADVIMSRIYKKEFFTWGSKNITMPGDSRTLYLNALREADNLNYNKLIDFAKS